MVLSFQTQELAREDVQEAQLPAVLIDVEVRHRPYERIPRVKDALLAHFVLWWSGMHVPLQPDQSHGSSFPNGGARALAPPLSPHLGSTILEGPYSPECVEEEFSEVRLDGILRSRVAKRKTTARHARRVSGGLQCPDKIEKGKPVARRGRKAHGPPKEVAGLPNRPERDQGGDHQEWKPSEALTSALEER